LVVSLMPAPTSFIASLVAEAASEAAASREAKAFFILAAGGGAARGEPARSASGLGAPDLTKSSRFFIVTLL
jgi:hypothetical protein